MGRCVEVKIGQVFNSLTVIGEAERRTTKGGRKLRMMQCRCKCGEVQTFPLAELRRGNSKRCKKCKYKKREAKVEKGDRYNSWTVNKELGRSKQNKRMFECVCKCGAVYPVEISSLRTGNSKHCIECGNMQRNKKMQLKFRNYRESRGFDPDVIMTPANVAEREIFGRTMRVRIFSRDNGKCQLCFKVAEVAHHIIPWSECYKPEDRQLRFDPENCIALCKECHLKAHGGCYNNLDRIDSEIAEQLMTKAIKNTEKHPEIMEGLTK